MKWSLNFRRCSSYIQGQYVGRTRQYFYFIDHTGRLFLDDVRIRNFTSCFKDVKFLDFFYGRLRLNKTGQYPDFPYISLCQGEQNFLKCDDRPIVFTKVDAEQNCLQVGNCSRMVEFEPEKICMFENGRVYHPARFDNYGLVNSRIADELYKNFEFDSNGKPTHFNWKGERCKLTNELLKFDR
ncbi:UPF0598 protein C8orf82 [Aphelenchoides bicaudatus]|nr:UPF0598 protein C8orf82 [Aphelenchoides bicaudatus]